MSNMKGICASTGVVYGIVVNIEEGIIEKLEGIGCYIIVSKSFTPDLLYKYNKSIGFITENGGMTCHAAILARMMRIPCIAGVENVTDKLHTLQQVRIIGNRLGESGEVEILNK